MSKINVVCEMCGSDLKRYPLNPSTKKPIKNFFCNIECKGRWQTKQREDKGFTKDWLYREYVILGKDANQIGREIGRNGKRVWEWLKGYEIDTRPRGSNYKENLIQDGSIFRGKNHTKETRERLSELSKKDGRLPWGKNNKHPLKDGDPKNHPSYKGGLTPERQAFYATKEWKEAVKKVWARDDATCQLCKKHHNEEKNRGTFHIHHIISFQHREFRARLDNLVLLCKECHLFVHSNKNTEKLLIKERRK